ncbi:hypothetical protein O6H91_Y470700 [Diphasiastrum complanatum]|nr:hypothetical protein O6H91_Y470700 [Diphasiastrum complanatum]
MEAFAATVTPHVSELRNFRRPCPCSSVECGSVSTGAVGFLPGLQGLKPLPSLHLFNRLSLNPKINCCRTELPHLKGCRWLQCSGISDGKSRQTIGACQCKRRKCLSRIRTSKGFGQLVHEGFVYRRRCMSTLAGQVHLARINSDRYLGGDQSPWRRHISIIARCEAADSGEVFASTGKSQKINGHNGAGYKDAGDSPDGSFDTLSFGAEGPIKGAVEESIASGSSGSSDLKSTSQSLETQKEDSSIAHLGELLHFAEADLENARIDSARLEENARMVAEKAIALKDQAVDAEGAAESARLRLKTLLADESAAELALQVAKLAFAAAGSQAKFAEDSLEQACRIADHKSAVTAAEIVEGSGNNNTKAKCEKLADSALVTVDLNTDKTIAERVQGPAESNAKETVLSEESAAISETTFKENTLQAAQAELVACEKDLAKSEAELFRIQHAIQELQAEVTMLSEVALRARAIAAAADEDVATAMSMAEKAVALELEAAQKLNDAEIAALKAESHAADAVEVAATSELTEKLAIKATKTAETFSQEEKVNIEMLTYEVDARPSTSNIVEDEGKSLILDDAAKEALKASPSEEVVTESNGSAKQGSPDLFDAERKAEDLSAESRRLDFLFLREGESEKVKAASPQLKKVEMLKDMGDSGVPKACTKKSSRFFPASFFSLDDGEEFSPKSVFSGIFVTLKQIFPTLVVGLLLVGAGYV